MQIFRKKKNYVEIIRISELIKESLYICIVFHTAVPTNLRGLHSHKFDVDIFVLYPLIFNVHFDKPFTKLRYIYVQILRI